MNEYKYMTKGLCRSLGKTELSHNKDDFNEFVCIITITIIHISLKYSVMEFYNRPFVLT